MKKFGLVFPATLIGIPAIIIGLIHKPYAIYGVFGALAFIGFFFLEVIRREFLAGLRGEEYEEASNKNNKDEDGPFPNNPINSWIDPYEAYGWDTDHYPYSWDKDHYHHQ